MVPLNLDRDVWVRAIDFRPSARAVVHHSLFFLDATGSARERDESDPGPGFAAAWAVACGSAARGRRWRSRRSAGRRRRRTIRRPIRSRAWQADSAAGRSAAARSNCPTGLAFPLPKGSDLILSTHFHPSGKAQMEKSTVGLYFASGPPTQAFTTIQLPPLFSVFEGLDIPAGQERYTIQDSFVIPIDVKAFSVGAHAHYLGKEMKLTATLPDGTAKTLLWIKDWDFSWQERYRFKDFVSLPKGTRLDAMVSYDNSAANKRNPSRPPVRVTWGEESTDEMGSIGLQVVAANRGELPQLQRAFNEHLRTAATTRPGLKQLLQRRAADCTRLSLRVPQNRNAETLQTRASRRAHAQSLFESCV